MQNKHLPCRFISSILCANDAVLSAEKGCELSLIRFKYIQGESKKK